MYSNIGGKIRGTAIAFFIIGAVVSVISGIVILQDAYREEVIWGLILLLFGVPVAWILSLPIYGFGVLIDKACVIESALCGGTVEKASDTAVKAGVYGEAEKLHAQGIITDEEYQSVLSGKQKGAE